MQIYNLMMHGFLAQALMLLLTLAMAAVIVSDAVRYLIPNWLNIALLAFFGVAAFFLPVHPVSGLMAAGLALAIGLGIFSLGFMGGGDVKLLVVLMLWTGWSMLSLQFLFLTGVFGGALVLIVLLLRRIVPPMLFHENPGKSLPRLLTRGQPVPYGIAIALAFLCLLWMGQIPGLPH